MARGGHRQGSVGPAAAALHPAAARRALRRRRHLHARGLEEGAVRVRHLHRRGAGRRLQVRPRDRRHGPLAVARRVENPRAGRVRRRQAAHAHVRGHRRRRQPPQRHGLQGDEAHVAFEHRASARASFHSRPRVILARRRRRPRAAATRSSGANSRKTTSTPRRSWPAAAAATSGTTTRRCTTSSTTVDRMVRSSYRRESACLNGEVSFSTPRAYSWCLSFVFKKFATLSRATYSTASRI